MLSGRITFVVPYSPGGGFDTYARGLANYMTKNHLSEGVSIVVENIETGGGTQGITKVFSAKPDGKTILILPMPAAIVRQMTMTDLVKYEVDKFTFLGSVDENAYVIYVNGKGPYQSYDDLVKKQETQELKILTVEKGSSSYTASAVAVKALGLNAKIITGAPGSKEVATALMRNDIDFVVYGTTDLTGFVESGDIKPVLFLGSEDQRPDWDWLKNVPSIADVGHPETAGAVTEARLIVTAPGTPPEITKMLRDALWATMHDQEFLEWAKAAKRTIVPKDGDGAEKLAKQQWEAMKKLVPELQAAGLL